MFHKQDVHSKYSNKIVQYDMSICQNIICQMKLNNYYIFKVCILQQVTSCNPLVNQLFAPSGSYFWHTLTIHWFQYLCYTNTPWQSFFELTSIVTNTILFIQLPTHTNILQRLGSTCKSYRHNLRHRTDCTTVANQCNFSISAHSLITEMHKKVI